LGKSDAETVSLFFYIKWKYKRKALVGIVSFLQAFSAVLQQILFRGIFQSRFPDRHNSG